LLPTSAGFLLGLFFETEDGGNMSLQNIRLSLNYMELQPRRPYSSSSLPENLKFNIVVSFIIRKVDSPMYKCVNKLSLYFIKKIIFNNISS
jgi:hypothetical protein